jgi:putative transposase
MPPRGAACCPWLTTVIDDATRVLAGWAIALTPHTGTVLTAVRMALVHDPARGPFGAIPAAVRIDRGLEFAAEAVHDAFAALSIDPRRLPTFHPLRKGESRARPPHHRPDPAVRAAWVHRRPAGRGRAAVRAAG